MDKPKGSEVSSFDHTLEGCLTLCASSKFCDGVLISTDFQHCFRKRNIRPDKCATYSKTDLYIMVRRLLKLRTLSVELKCAVSPREQFLHA